MAAGLKITLILLCQTSGEFGSSLMGEVVRVEEVGVGEGGVGGEVNDVGAVAVGGSLAGGL